MAAQNRWPVLLTQTEVLTGATRDYLQRSGASAVTIVGGPAAVSPEVEGQLVGMGLAVDRLAGANRFETATEIADKLGAETAADAARITLVEGQDADAWAGGFAAAGHAAVFDAPIVLANGADLPPATEAFLSGGPGLQSYAVEYEPAGPPVLTCVTEPGACEDGRQELGLPAAATVSFDPAEGGAVTAGQRVTITITGQSPASATLSGGCVSGSSTAQVEGGTVTATIAGSGACDLVVSFALPNGAVQTSSASYVAEGAVLQLVSQAIDGTAARGIAPDISDDGSTVIFVSDGEIVRGVTGTHLSAMRDGEVEVVDVRPDGTPGASAQLHSAFGRAHVGTRPSRPLPRSTARSARGTRSGARTSSTAS